MNDLPKCLFNAPNIVFPPIPLRNLFLTDRDSAPADPHDSNVIYIVLIKRDLETREMSFGPLIQSPALNDLCWLSELEIFAGDVAAKELKLTAFLGALEKLGCGARESGNALRVSEGLVELAGWRAELFGVGDGCGVD